MDDRDFQGRVVELIGGILVMMRDIEALLGLLNQRIASLEDHLMLKGKAE